MKAKREKPTLLIPKSLCVVSSTESAHDMSELRSSSSEMDLDRPNIEEYLTVSSIHETSHDEKLLLYLSLSLSVVHFIKRLMFLVLVFHSSSRHFFIWLMGIIFLLSRRDLLDISPTLTEAAGAIVDVSPHQNPTFFSFFF